MTTDGNVLRRAMVLAPQAAAVREARILVKEACQAAGTHEVTCDAAVLLTSETVTNAFVHGRSEARLEVAAGPESVHVEVGDDNSRHPTGQPRDEDALDGRGLEIVRMLAARWGVRDEPFGKVVWFEVRSDHVGPL
jgi:anti-sigma regulatory factor (Ser/Thr protein kinase)